MIVTVFRSRLKPEAYEEYMQWATRMGELARTMPGYVSHKVFIAQDGERATIVEFDTEEHQRVWATNTEHVAAKQKGRKDFYSEYSLQICEELRSHRFANP